MIYSSCEKVNEAIKSLHSLLNLSLDDYVLRLVSPSYYITLIFVFNITLMPP